MPISTELLNKAKEELREKPECRESDIQVVRDMVLAEKDLNCRMDDEFVLRFLRARKFDYDRAFQLLRNYYAMRLQNADLYVNFRPSSLMHVFDQNLQIMLPKYDQLGRKVFIVCLGKWDPEKCNLNDIFRANIMCMEKAIEEEETQINGFVNIVDLKDFGFTQAKYIRPTFAKRLLSLVQDCFPGRFKGFHFVNESTIFDILFVIFKPFLKDKIKSRIFCHGHDMKSLHEYVCPDILPQEYGGSQPPMDNVDFVRTLLDKDEEFFSSTKYGYNKIIENTGEPM